jgi:hypothetical protein
MATVGKLNGVEFIRPEVVEMLPIYEQIADCLKGEHAVKHRKWKYLPMPNADDQSSENMARYEAYLRRAVFFNVTARTHGGAVGFMFLRDPVVKLPPKLNVLAEDATGEGVPLVQATKQAVAQMIANGRAGLWADYPKTDGSVTVADLETGGIQPTLRVYEAQDMINWRYEKKGGVWQLVLVVLREIIDLPLAINRFEMMRVIQYRVLELNDAGDYAVTVWRRPVAGVLQAQPTPAGLQSLFQIVESTVIPTDADGNTFKEIPFEFLGVWKNVAKPDQPPLYDMSVLNLAHYRNSADYEESCFIVGQPTPWASGLTEAWVKDILHGKIAIGSRGLIPLPVNGAAGLLQAAPNIMPKEAMDSKEQQMRAIGAKLVANSDKSAPDKTATEASINNVSETSVLSNVARNVSMGFTKALGWCARFVGETGKIDFEVHADLGLSQMTSLDRAQLIAEWQAGAITWNEMRAAYHQAGIATEDDDLAKEDIANEQADQLQLVAENSVAPIVPGSTNDPAANQQPADKKAAS